MLTSTASPGRLRRGHLDPLCGALRLDIERSRPFSQGEAELLRCYVHEIRLGEKHQGVSKVGAGTAGHPLWYPSGEEKSSCLH